MEQIVAKLVSEFEGGKLTRRQLIQNLTVALTAGSALSTVQAAAAEKKVLQASYINHVEYRVANYAKTRDFYADLFGMKVAGDNGKTHCDLLFGDNMLKVYNVSAPYDPELTKSFGPVKLGIDHIAYTIANWDAEKDANLAELKRRGFKPTFPHPDQNTGFILDPDGSKVQFGGFKQ